MNSNLTTYIVSFVLLIFCMGPVFSVIALATEAISDPLEPSSNDLWNCLSEFQQSSGLYNMLLSNGWIKKDVTFSDFDYILVLSDQICTMNPNVRLSLILAMIAVESRFDAEDEYYGACGLMQITHSISNRMEPFVEEGHVVCEDDMFDIRLNLAAGIDYINYILEETDGDEAYALMWYNQGPISASEDYLEKSMVSDYAASILSLTHEIEPYLTTGGVE